LHGITDGKITALNNITAGQVNGYSCSNNRWFA